MCGWGELLTIIDTLGEPTTLGGLEPTVLDLGEGAAAPIDVLDIDSAAVDAVTVEVSACPVVTIVV